MPGNVPVVPSVFNDTRRLAAVQRSAMFGAPSEPIFDELTKAAAILLRAPYALISIMGDTDSYWKSTFGLADSMRSEPITESFCQYVVAGGQDLLVEDVRASEVTRSNPTIESKGVRAWAGTPIELDGELLGTLCVIDSTVRAWSIEDHNVLRSLAAIASHEISMRAEIAAVQGAAVSAQGESDRMRSLLDTLRASLLPPRIPHIEHADIATWFEPASDGEMLLGDFYDVFPLGDDRWSVVVGDVCGHGVEAAKLTSLVRYSLRAAAMHHRDLDAMMSEVDRAIRLDDLDVGRFATVCYFEVDARREILQVRWARAGHPFPIRIGSDGNGHELLGADGPPLGIETGSGWTEGRFELHPGETVVLYTDGVTESRLDASGERLQIDGLVELVSSRSENEPVFGEQLVGRLVDELHRVCSHCADDRAVVVISPA